MTALVPVARVFTIFSSAVISWLNRLFGVPCTSISIQPTRGASARKASLT
ncbi:MAG: hypothetical protein GWO04_49500 [Actinobacteria bacterium]|nr:hypothetical protein [Actinomycetota bacterium]